MTGTTNGRSAALNSFLNQAAADLAQSSGDPLGGDAEGLLFLGAWHQSYPAILVRDPFLSDSAKVHFLYLMQESSQRPHGAIPMPSLEETTRMLGHSRRTVGRDRMLLRVCRWVSLCRTVRDRRGRFQGNIFAIHSEPCALAEGNRLDQSYLTLLNQARANRDRYLKRAARAALNGIDQALGEGRDPLELPDPVNRRLDAAVAVQNGSGCFFDLLLTENTKPIDEGRLSTTHFQNCHSGDTAIGSGEAAKFAHGQPCANFAHGNQLTELSENSSNNPQNAKFAHGYCSSSTTTTTEKQTREENLLHGSEARSLRWPKQFDEGQRTMVQRAMDNEEIPAKQQQEIVDVLAHKTLDSDNPLRSPVGYAFKLCQRIKSGTFQPVTPPASSPAHASHNPATNGSSLSKAKSELRQTRAQIFELQSEIGGLEQNLIPMAREADRSALEAARDRYQGRLTDLKRRYKALRDGNEPASDGPHM